MREEQLQELLGRVATGDLSVAEALQSLRFLPFEDLGYAKVDHHRPLRTGFPEVIFCQGKQPWQVAEIAERLRRQVPVVLATRANEEAYTAVCECCPEATYDATARIIRLGEPDPPRPGIPPALVITAGTSDIPVAEEAAAVIEAASVPARRLFDVGVSGLHRLLRHRDELVAAGAIVVVAGMEGALASVVGGLVDKPVIGVPTSVGYGASFGGVAALLSMLNSCAAGLAVVNIDNGFGAGYMAAMICRLAAPPA